MCNQENCKNYIEKFLTIDKNICYVLSKFELNNLQNEYINLAYTHDRFWLESDRHSGKTIIASAHILYEALCSHKSIIFISHCKSSAERTRDIIVDMLSELSLDIKVFKNKLEFQNGSIIHFSTYNNTFRGRGYDICVFDEINIYSDISNIEPLIQDSKKVFIISSKYSNISHKSNSFFDNFIKVSHENTN